MAVKSLAGCVSCERMRTTEFRRCVVVQADYMGARKTVTQLCEYFRSLLRNMRSTNMKEPGLHVKKRDDYASLVLSPLGQN